MAPVFVYSIVLVNITFIVLWTYLVNWVSFLRQVQKYTEITELNATIVHEFIEKIVVYKATKDDAGHRIQHIRIYYNFLGDVEIPDEWLDDEQDAGAPDENEQEETA